MTDLVLRPLADAFMQVGVYVAVMVAFFGWLRWRYGDGVTSALTRRPRLGPLVGALLGVTPGCGGAIILMPLYARGRVSFGTVVGALVATMGDSSWVVLAWNPLFALQLHVLLFVVGLVTGYVVDALGIDPARTARPAGWGTGVVARSGTGVAAGSARVPQPASPACCGPTRAAGRGGPAGTAAAADLHWGALLPRVPASTAFWGLTTPAFAVSVPVVFQLVDPTALTRTLGGLDPYLALGVLGTLTAALIFAAGRGRLADETLETAQPRSVGATLRHSAHEASFVTVWVAVAYLGWQLVTGVTGFDGSQLALAGLAGVLVGALVGLIPGCAVQIVFTGLYTSGGLPLPTLVANAISQDGDALIPLAALRRRSAVTATVITTVPALAVGAALLVLL
ncbi:Putative, 10TM heavy-metal exporter [Micromonospora nigra]|uniref:Putative, 10TM heavy-metal exporter n=1 Tax=Micromonospora nigra TaxID=145857 RepID=A0A1C6SS80_9ACTN|nr:putative manganese transporter [Micromonospora nigra]SCL32426.1 Putative, 10TM heavy-metal exporter [Micromonospora nigra]